MDDFDEKKGGTDFILVNPAAKNGENAGEEPKIAPGGRKGGKKRGAVVLAVLAVLAAGAAAAGIFSKKGESRRESPPIPDFRTALRHKGALRLPAGECDYIAELDIEGEIEKKGELYNHENLLSAVEMLADEPRNKGIVLKIDSPGGTVYESDEAYLALTEYKQKTGRPVWAHFESLGASGAYYIACSADKIFANRNSLVGSIGVIAGSAVDATGLLERCGVKIETFASGRNKNMLGINSPVTEEQREIMRSIADDAYEQFVQIVADSREMPQAAVRNLADGRIYTARQAEKLGMIDGIGGFDDFCEKMKEFCGSADLKIERIELVEERGFLDKIRRISEGAASRANPASVALPKFAESLLESRVEKPSYIFRR